MNKNGWYSQKTALKQRECKLLLHGVREVDCDHSKSGSQSIAFLDGRVDLGPGKTTHIREEWLNRWRGYIGILLNDPCGHGRGSGLCDLCRQSSHQRVEYHDTLLGEAQMQTANLVQLIDNLPEPVLLLTAKGEHFVQEVDL